MRGKKCEALLRTAVGGGLVLMVCYSLAAMPIQIQFFRTADFLWPVARQYLPLVLPLTELFFAYGILCGKKTIRWAVSLYYFLLGVSALFAAAFLNPWQPDCDCKGLLRLAADVQKNTLIILVSALVLIGFNFAYLYCLKLQERLWQQNK